jgi:hypothetical protein
LRIKNPVNIAALRTKPGVEIALLAHYAGYPVENLILASSFNASERPLNARLALISSFPNIDEISIVEKCGGNDIYKISYAKKVFLIVKAVAESEGFSTSEIEDLFVKHAVMVDFLATPMEPNARKNFRYEFKLLVDLYERSYIDLVSSCMSGGSDTHYWAIGDLGMAAAQK